MRLCPSGHKSSYKTSYGQSLAVLKAEGWPIRETEDVHADGLRSGTASRRAAEMNSLFRDPDVRAVLCATGGDFLLEVLPEIDWKNWQMNPKWLMGMSDPTGLLFPYTACYDVATLYGMNAGRFYPGRRYRYIRNSLDILHGRKVIQKSYHTIDSRPPFSEEPLAFDRPAHWHSSMKEAEITGRCLGGCIDVMRELIGTPYDGGRAFAERYADDGIIWCFDIFSLSAEAFYRTLLQMRYAGWFAHSRAVIIGRVLLAASETGMTYAEAAQTALPVTPVFWEADIGHTLPCMTLINGSIMKLTYSQGHAEVSFLLK